MRGLRRICLLLFLLHASLALGQETCLPETGPVFEELTSFDAMMRTFVAENEIPGAALAVAKDGRLVYARGFGYADVEKKHPVQPDALFRIASISKPITAVAVMQLVQRGELALDDRAFAQLPRDLVANDGDADPRLQEITVRQLLQHTGGWDRSISGDPMFRAVEIAEARHRLPPASPQDVIRFMADKPLDFTPGQRYAYSNLGYCLLGRIVEHVTGECYEEHVRRDLLAPIGADAMRLGKTLPDGRMPEEVCYYTRGDSTGPAVMGSDVGADVPSPYGAWCLESMDAHGGWVASAVDLLRFATAVEGSPESGLLTQESIEAMCAPPSGAAGHNGNGQAKDVYYGVGWMVRHVNDSGAVNRWHSGSLPGTSTLLVIRHDGLCWAVLFNTRDMPEAGTPSGKIDPLVHRAANAVKHWPEHDLFSRFTNHFEF